MQSLTAIDNLYLSLDSLQDYLSPEEWARVLRSSRDLVDTIEELEETITTNEQLSRDNRTTSP